MDFLMGILGFLGYEGIRIYKKLVNDENSVPETDKLPFYIFIITMVSIFSGILAYEINPNNNIYAIYIGFSVPSSLKFLNRGTKDIVSGSSEDTIGEVDAEDIEIEKPSRKEILIDQIKNLRYWTNWYFS